MWLCCCCCYVGDFFIIIIYYEFYKYIFLVVCVYVNVVSNFTKKSLLFVYRYFITYILLLLYLLHLIYHFLLVQLNVFISVLKIISSANKETNNNHK